MADTADDPTIHRMVGESYKEYAARMYGRARAAERDRDTARAEVAQLRAQLAEHEATRTIGGPPPPATPGWTRGDSSRPPTAPQDTP